MQLFSKKIQKGLTKKDLIDKELELYKKEKMLDIDRQVEDYKKKRSDEMINLAILCAEQIGGHEHNFHSKREEIGIEIARLEAKKELLESQVETINRKLLR